MRSAALLLACTAAQAADIGGWMDQQSRAALARDDCPQIVREATRASEDAALAYASGLCYLLSEKLPRDRTAAQAWLARAAEKNHPLARRALAALRSDDAIDHPAGTHCHDLGDGRRLCHGGPAPQ